MSEKNIFDESRGDADITETLDKIRREAAERKAARDAEKQATDEFFNRMKTDNLII